MSREWVAETRPPLPRHRWRSLLRPLSSGVGCRRQSLPAWLYTDQRFFELEREKVFRPAWHIVGHINDAPNPGDYITLDILGERVVTLRGEDGRVRSFHNVCRHRAGKIARRSARLVRASAGVPLSRLELQARRHVRRRAEMAGLRGAEGERRSLTPVEQEIFMGFIFIRFEPGLPSVAEMMAPYAEELAPYELEKLVPNGRVTLRPRPGELEECRRQLFRRHAHPGGPSRALAPVRRDVQDRGARMGGQDVGRRSPMRPRPIGPSAPIRNCSTASRTSRASAASSGSITSSGPISPSTSIPTRSISCNSSRCRRPKR